MYTTPPAATRRERDPPLTCPRHPTAGTPRRHASVGDAAVKLRWAKNLGAVAALTWLTSTATSPRGSGVPHHLDALRRRRRHVRAPRRHVRRRRAAVRGGVHRRRQFEIPAARGDLGRSKGMNVTSYLGTWKQVTAATATTTTSTTTSPDSTLPLQTALNRADNRSWKALDREGYAAQLSKAKMRVSTTGPSNIVGTRYFAAQFYAMMREHFSDAPSVHQVLRSARVRHHAAAVQPPARRRVDLRRAVRGRSARPDASRTQRAAHACSHPAPPAAGVHVATFGDMPELRRKISLLPIPRGGATELGAAPRMPSSKRGIPGTRVPGLSPRSR